MSSLHLHRSSRFFLQQMQTGAAILFSLSKTGRTRLKSKDSIGELCQTWWVPASSYIEAPFSHSIISYVVFGRRVRRCILRLTSCRLPSEITVWSSIHPFSFLNWITIDYHYIYQYSTSRYFFDSWYHVFNKLVISHSIICVFVSATSILS